MKIMLNGAKDTILNKILPLYPHYRKYIGWMNTPNSSYCFKGLKDTGLNIVCDNGCYTGLNEKRFTRMLEKAQEAEVSLDWVTVPDVLSDAKATLSQFEVWAPQIIYPLAYVLQDGAEDTNIPFENFNCLFIGGSTEYKLSTEARAIAHEAKRLGKLIHMGRVNTNKHLRYAMQIGCDSVDGTGYVRYRQRELLPALHIIHKKHLQRELL